MFILIPLTLTLVSVVAISFIIFRKMPYLNKLTPETHLPVNGNAGKVFLADLLPELFNGINGFKFKEYGNLWLVELEKLLRRLRVISLKIDRISDSWIKKIRSGNNFKTVIPLEVGRNDFSESVSPKSKIEPTMTTEELKREEQRLIMEIAKNPKDARSYEVLGDLYVKMNNYIDAKESFEAGMELNPNNEVLQKKHSQVVQKMVV